MTTTRHSYANNRTNLITLTFNERKTSPSHCNWVQVAVTLIFAFLLFTAVTLSTVATWSQYFRVNALSNLVLNVMPMESRLKVEAVPPRRIDSEQRPATTRDLLSKYRDLYEPWPSPYYRGCENRDHTAGVWNFPALSDLFHCCDCTLVRTTRGKVALCETQVSIYLSFCCAFH